MKVSIITVCYNSGKTISETIQSVINQTYQDIEYIIVDGGSKDNTKSIIKSFKSRIDHFISEPDNGMYDAINKGISLACGDVVGLLHSDDVFADPDVINGIVSRFNDGSPDIIWGDVVFINSKNIIIRYYCGEKITPKSFNIGIMPPHPSVFIKRSCYDMFGNFNTTYAIAADYDLLLRFIVLNKLKYGYIKKIITRMKTGGSSNNSIFSVIKLNIEIYRIHRVNSIPLRWNFLVRKLPMRIKELINTVK